MKDSEFIELLNLYLDHEISGDDAKRLEAEVQGNPARRKVYQDYCRMQKACKVFAHEFQTDTAAAADRKVVAFEPAGRPARNTGFYAIGTFAAVAACLAIVFIGRNRERGTPAEATQSVVAVSADASKSVVSAKTSAAPVAGATAAAVMMPSLTLAGNAQADAAAAQFAWLTSMQITPIQERAPLEELRFEARSANLRTESRTYTAREGAQNNNTEWVAIRYTK